MQSFNNYFFLVMLTGILPCISSCTLKKTTPKDLLTQSSICPGWDLDTSGACSRSSIEKPQQLYDIIDGAAPTYLDRGFSGGVFLGYTDGESCVCVEIYDQAKPANARTLYQAPDFVETGEYRTVPSLGESARVDTSSLFAAILEIVSGPYFIRLTIPSKDKHVQELVEVLARALVKKLQ